MTRHLPLAALVFCLALATLTAMPADARADHSDADLEIAFADGLLAFHDGDLSTALERFEEVVAADPGDRQARRWLEATRARLRDDGDEDVAAPAWVEGTIRVTPELPRFDGRLALAVAADSNPYLLSDDLVLSRPDGEILDGPEEDLVGLGDLRLALRPFAGGGGGGGGGRSSFSLVGELGAALHRDFDDLDTTRARVLAQLAWGRDPRGYVLGPLGYARTPLGSDSVSFLLQVGGSRAWVDGEAAVDRVEVAGSMTLRPGGWGLTRLQARYRDAESDTDRPGAGTALDPFGEEIAAGVVQTFFLGRPDRYLRLGAEAGEIDAGLAYDRSFVDLSVELALPVGRDGRSTLYLAGGGRRDDFDDPVSTFFLAGADDTREDETLRAGAGLVTRLGDQFALTGRVGWSDRDSDLGTVFGGTDFLSYDRTLASLGLVWNF